MPSMKHRLTSRSLSWRTLSISLMSVAIFAFPASAAQPTPDLSVGKKAYDLHCARCHGITGAGDGVDARKFYPRPRDLSYGVYKFRSTVSGTPPTDEDIFHTITVGLPGSNMPDWKHLPEETRWQLVYYLKSLSDIFEEESEVVSITTPDPGHKGANLKVGREVYDKLGCASCHGEQGLANGTSAAGLVDDWGMAIRPANLSQGWNYRGGKEPSDIMMRFLAGIDGSGMPSYMGTVTEEEAWHISYYVAAMQEQTHWSRILTASQAKQLPGSLDEKEWKAIPQIAFRARNVVDNQGTWTQPPTINLIKLQTVYNDDAIAFRIQWDDPTEDKVGNQADRLALLLRTEGDTGDSVTLQAWPLAKSADLDAHYWVASKAKATEKIISDYNELNGSAGVPLVKSEAQYQDGRWTLMLVRKRHQASVQHAENIEAGDVMPVAFAVWDAGNPEARAVTSWIDVTIHPDVDQHAVHAH